MIIRENLLGIWIKDGVRYAIRPDEGQSRVEMVAEAELGGYVKQPLTEEEKVAANEARVLLRAKNRKKAELASARYDAELGGVTLPNGIFVSSDIKTRLALSAGVITIQQNPDFIFENYKMPDGTFMNMDASSILYIYNSMTSFVSECFNKERLLSDQVDEATTVEEVNAIVW